MGKGPLTGQRALDAVQAAPANQVAEVLDGELYTFPRPALPHADATTALGSDLRSAFDKGRDGPGGWIILFGLELHLGDGPDILVPNLAGWRRERVPKVPDAPFFDVAPDWLCEVSSPSTARVDRTKKLKIYAREQVARVWMVSPAARLLEVLALDGDTYQILSAWGEDDVIRAPPFEAVGIELAGLWGR